MRGHPWRLITLRLIKLVEESIRKAAATCAKMAPALLDAAGKLVDWLSK